MKLRIEPSGFHWFDRVTGIHILLDEITPNSATWSAAPRTLSIALSNVCDLGCHFCYRPRNSDSLPPDFVQEMVLAADRLGAFEITFGGGEPLLYPDLIPLCRWIWRNTALGISLTTHGHHLTRNFIHQLTGSVSSLRLSIDGVEPYYSQVRGRPLADLLENIRTLDGAIPFGINVVVSPGHLTELRPVADLALAVGAADLLFIPEHRKGKSRLAPHEWEEIDRVIDEYRPRCRLGVTESACAHLAAGVLQTERAQDFVFAHVSADRMLKPNSYGRAGIVIEDPAGMSDYLLALRHMEEVPDENMANVLQ